MNTKVKPVEVLSETATSALIASIGRRGIKMDRDVWQAAISSLSHAEACGDFSLFQKLLNAMPKGTRVATLIGWAKTIAPVDVGNNPAGYKVKKAENGNWDIDHGRCSPWWEHKNAVQSVTLDLPALAAMLTKLAESKDSASRTVTAEARALAAELAATVKKVMAPTNPVISRRAA